MDVRGGSSMRLRTSRSGSHVVQKINSIENHLREPHMKRIPAARSTRAIPTFRQLAVAASVLGALSAPGVAAPPLTAGEPGIVGYVPGRVLVQPRAGLEDREFDDIVGKHGGKRGKHMKEINVHVVEVAAGGEEAVIRALKKNKHVKFAELDLILAPSLLPNDPYYGSAWHLAKIDAAAAWVSGVGEGVVIAILDSGVDPSHPDLAGQLVPGWNVYDNNSSTSDVYGHGTKVAGTAAAATNNALGVSSVTWRAKVMPIRITDLNGYATVSKMASGITFAADNGARVASISFESSCGNATVQSAAQYMRNKGGVVVIAAGNTGVASTSLESSAVTCVSATDGNDVKASWSTYGSMVDVAAPGVGIWSTVRGGGYGAVSGTSFAAPLTAGVYALMMSANSALPPGTLDQVLFATAVDLGAAGRDELYGNGRINAGAAVQTARNTVAVDTQAPFVSIAAPAGGKVSGVISVDVNALDNVGVTRVDLFVNGSPIGSDGSAPYAFSWNSASLADGPAALQAKAYDGAGNQGNSANVAVTVANDTIAPTVRLSNPTDGSVVSGTVYVTVSASDNNRVSGTSLAINGKLVASTTGSSLTYTWLGTTGKGKNRTSLTGPFTLTATAQDPAGNSASQSAVVTRQ